MASQDLAQKAASGAIINVFAFLLNVSSSVVLIFIIKALMSIYNFKFATTISGLHFLVCAWIVWGAERCGFSERAEMPVRDSLIFAFVGSMSIGTANLSLLLNSVGFYQIAKLLMAPFVCFMEIVWIRKRFPNEVIVCIGVVLAGVAVVTVTDVTVNMPGLIMAILFVVSSGMQQILCGYYQRIHGLTSHQLMSNTSFLQGMMLLIVGPAVDKAMTDRWVQLWAPNLPVVNMLLLSCLFAIAVNVSQFLCLGRFSATTFQVLGHLKTILVLLGGWLLFEEFINHKQLIGMSLAVFGMMGYGYYASRPVRKVASTDIRPAKVESE